MKATLKDIFRDPPILYTDHLTLRKMNKGDAEDMFEYACLEETTKYLLWEPHPNQNYTLKYLAIVGQKYRNGEFYDWAIDCGGKMIGTCGFASLDFKNMCGEIGYVVSPKYHNMGYATEAAKAVLDFGFRSLHLHRISARFMEGNDPSRKVMEKLGMEFEGMQKDCMLVKGKFVTVGTYAKINK